MQDGREHENESPAPGGAPRPLPDPDPSGADAARADAKPVEPGTPATPPSDPGAWPGYPPPGYAQPFYGPPSYAQPGYGPPPASPWQAQPGTQPIWAGPGAGQQSWAPPPAGQPSYGGPWAPPPGGYGPPPPGQPRPSRGPLGRALVYVVVAVLAAAVGAGAVFALRGGAARSPVVSSQAAKPHTNTSGDGAGPGFDPNAVAGMVEPGIVNITSRLTLQQAVFEGTGMVLTPNGLVLTNNHVINGATAASLRVTLAGTHRTYRAQVVGWDPVDDVALLQLQGASHLKTVDTGNSAFVKVGDRVVALGNAGGQGGPPKVTSGRVTGLHKTIVASDSGSGASETLHNMLEINALIQPGDSGGPLANGAGEVIGMNTAANTASFGQGDLAGYSIPIDQALALVHQMVLHQSSSAVHIGPPPFIGIAIASNSSQGTSTATSPRTQRQQLYRIAHTNNSVAVSTGSQCLPNEVRSPVPASVAPATSGALIGAVFCSTPAATSGLQAGDVIVAVDGRTVTSAASLHAVISNYHPGDTVSLTWVDLSGHRHTSPLRLAAGPVK